MLAPLLYIVALAVKRKHDSGLKNLAHLKIVLSNTRDVSHFARAGDMHTRGIFTGKNTLFAAINVESGCVSEQISIVFHEASHFVANEVMKNNSNPYKENDEVAKNEYFKIIQNVKKNLDRLSAKNEMEKEVVENFRDIFDYPEKEQPAELFVMFAQTISLLGYEKGYAWLKENVSDFVEFYEKRFYSACLEYLVEHDAQENLRLSKSFCDILDEIAMEKIQKNLHEALNFFKNS